MKVLMFTLRQLTNNFNRLDTRHRLTSKTTKALRNKMACVQLFSETEVTDVKVMLHSCGDRRSDCVVPPTLLCSSTFSQ